VVAEALGLALTHSALAPSGHPIWLDMARHSARAVLAQQERALSTRHILTAAALRNAMVTYARLRRLHQPAVAPARRRPRRRSGPPHLEDWTAVNRQVPRLVDVAAQRPAQLPTIVVFLAGGGSRVMLHLRRAGLLALDALTASGTPSAKCWIGGSIPSAAPACAPCFGIAKAWTPTMSSWTRIPARRRGLTSAVTFPKGNLAPGGAVVKSTAIDPSLLDSAGVYRLTGPARVFTTEPAAIAAIKDGRIHPGDVLALIGRGPLGAGMEETYQLTAALKYLDFGKHVAVLTDARFSGVSTGACIGHISPEALAGGRSAASRTAT